MQKNILKRIGHGAAVGACAMGIQGHLHAGEPPAPEPSGEAPATASAEPAADPPTAAARPAPKPLSNHVRKGLDYLVETQHETGGWGQGGGWRVNLDRNGRSAGGRVEGKQVADPPDIGNTAISLLAFLRSGESFTEGPYAETMTRAARFLLDETGRNDDETLYVTAVRDTQLQSKIGAYVDTFLAALVLSELKDRLPTPELEESRDALLARVVGKIEKNQREDGTFDGNHGWAAVLSQGLCSTALNRAWLAGASVSDKALRQDARNNGSGVVAGQTTIAEVAGEPTSAGIDIYRYAAKLNGLNAQALNNASGRRSQFEGIIASKETSESQKAEAREELAAISKNDRDADVALKAVQAQAANTDFVKGFGNNGGEEFLSYMNISEAMCAKGGKEFAEWDVRMTKTINAAQNADGSWAGQHCITGRTFCTATALLTLMADRAPLPQVASGNAPDTGVSGAEDPIAKEAATEATAR